LDPIAGHLGHRLLAPHAPPGTLLFIGGTGGAARPSATRSSGRCPRLAPAHRQPGARAGADRVNLIAAGFVDTPLSASLLG
jgi:hypothetical protein